MKRVVWALVLSLIVWGASSRPVAMNLGNRVWESVLQPGIAKRPNEAVPNLDGKSMEAQLGRRTRCLARLWIPTRSAGDSDDPRPPRASLSSPRPPWGQVAGGTEGCVYECRN